MDVRQIRALTRYTLLSEWRQASMRMVRGRRKTSRLWAYGGVLMYLFMGAVVMRLFSAVTTSDAYLATVSLFGLYLAALTASNIFLSFGSGFLSPDEATIIAPMPVASDTFFLSRLAILIVYSSSIALLISIGPCIALLYFAHGVSLLSALAMLVSSFCSSVAAALTVIVLYGLLLRRLSRAALAKAIGYAQFFGSMLIAASFVILPRVGRRFDLAQFVPSRKPLLLFVPSYWFGGIAATLSGAATDMNVELALAGVLSIALLSWGSYVLLGKHYQSEVSELAQSGAALAKQTNKKPGFIYRLYIRLARSHEARAVFMIIRAQFRFDTKFRVSLLAVLPMPFIYLGLALMQGGVTDPFAVVFSKGAVGAQMIYFFAMLMPMLIMQNMTMTENYRAAWIFFALPVERAKLLLAVRNTILITFILPYLIVLCIVFTYFMPVLHAIEHILVLGALGNFVFQGFLILQARMPFAQQRRPNQRGVAQIFGAMMLAVFPMVLLVLDMYFGYRTPIRYWTTVALLLTLSVLVERLVRTRVAVKLDREEFDG